MPETPAAALTGPAAQPVVQEVIRLVSLGIELLAIAIIVAAILDGSIRYLLAALARPAPPDAYGQYKGRLGKALLLGLEILVAADIIRTVALEPSLSSVAALGVLVLIRTFLSWSLVVEIEGRWPWQGRRTAGPAGEGKPAAGAPDQP